MSTEWVKNGVEMDLHEMIKSSPSYEMVQELINKYPKNHQSGGPDRSVFSLKFIPAPDMQITNPNGLVGFVEIGETFKISDFLKSNIQAPIGPDGQPLTAEDVQQENNVYKLLNQVFPKNIDQQCQRQLGLSDVKLPVFIRDELMDQHFPSRLTTDKLVQDCINHEAEQLKIEWDKTLAENLEMSKRIYLGAEERIEKGIPSRSIEETIQEYGEKGIEKKLAGTLAMAFTASAQANFHFLQAAKFIESIDECREEFEEYSKIIPHTAQKIKEIYLKNHYIYETLRQSIENSHMWVSKELKDFYEEAKALNAIIVNWTDQKQHAVNAAIKNIFYQRMFDVYDEKMLPIDGVFKHVEELHHLIKTKSPPFMATEAQAEADAKVLWAGQAQEFNNECYDREEEKMCI